jgi:hypothetical protein
LEKHPSATLKKLFRQMHDAIIAAYAELPAPYTYVSGKRCGKLGREEGGKGKELSA